jgi:hypothetical protein
VRKDSGRVEHHLPCHSGYVLGTVRDVGTRDPKPEKSPPSSGRSPRTSWG